MTHEDDVVLHLTADEYRIVLSALGWMDNETRSDKAARLRERLEYEHGPGDDPRTRPTEGFGG